MRIRENLSGITSAIGKNNFTPASKAQVGRVYGVVTTENTPTKKQYERAGGVNGVGTIFYLDYDQAKNIVGDNSDNFLDTCKTAIPLQPNINYYPLLGELVLLDDYPSAASQISNTSIQKYYSSIINIWNNNQHNSQPAGNTTDLGSSFVESSDIRPLLNFEGDFILQGRKGNSLRFGSTTRLLSNLNEWSNIGTDGSPILIISNGHKPSGSIHVEQINKENSSIYLTSTQQIPLQPDRNDILNSITQPTAVNLYYNSQVILNGDRVVINSKLDEVMLFAKTNIEVNTNNIINLNANNRVHINSPIIKLGTIPPNPENGTPAQYPTEPLLLGNQTVILLKDLIQALNTFASIMNSNITPPSGLPVDTGGASAGLMEDLKDIISRLSSLLSKTSYTV